MVVSFVAKKTDSDEFILKNLAVCFFIPVVSIINPVEEKTFHLVLFISQINPTFLKKNFFLIFPNQSSCLFTINPSPIFN